MTNINNKLKEVELVFNNGTIELKSRSTEIIDPKAFTKKESIESKDYLNVILIKYFLSKEFNNTSKKYVKK
ncbi:hypothetical protein CYK68_06300 [Clostridium perfringens]|nr:hypothetical protein CYK68_06300 [Clostridium perfringens]PWX17123.1 hypothetical protein CYK66_01645 [Clostridium perfringens]